MAKHKYETSKSTTLQNKPLAGTNVVQTNSQVQQGQIKDELEALITGDGGNISDYDFHYNRYAIPDKEADTTTYTDTGTAILKY